MFVVQKAEENQHFSMAYGFSKCDVGKKYIENQRPVCIQNIRYTLQVCWFLICGDIKQRSWHNNTLKRLIVKTLH